MTKSREPSGRALIMALAAFILLGARGLAAQPQPPQGAPAAAPYLWGGLLDRGGSGVARFHRSVGFLLDAGFTALRFTVSSSALPEIGLPDGTCRRDQGIACVLEHALAGPAFDRPRLELLILTLHEFAARDALAEGLPPPVRAAVTAELDAALEVLGRRFAGRRTRIVISNWEGDNMVYCGSAFRYARQPAFAANCDRPGGDGVDRRLAHFVDWMAARDASISAFRARRPDMEIEHAPEFNLARFAPENCATRCEVERTVFEALTRGGRRPLCSYSSYNSTNRGALAEDLPGLLRGCNRLIIGELGFDAQRFGSNGARQGFAHAADTVSRFGDRIVAVVIWNAFNRAGPGPKDGYGLFGPDGSPALLRSLPRAFLPRPAE